MDQDQEEAEGEGREEGCTHREAWCRFTGLRLSDGALGPPVKGAVVVPQTLTLVLALTLAVVVAVAVLTAVVTITLALVLLLTTAP